MSTILEDCDPASYFYPLISTGTGLDELNPRHYIKEDGTLVLIPGGLGRITLVYGQANVAKTLLATNLIVRAMERIPGSDLIVKTSLREAEDVDLISKYSTLHLDDPDKRKDHLQDLESRISTFGIEDDDPRFDTFVAWLKEKADAKIARGEELKIDPPFINLYTLEPHRMLVPTFLLVDRWDDLTVTLPEGCIAPALERSAIMKDLLKDIFRMCYEANIYLVITKELVKRIDLVTGKPTSFEEYPSGRLTFLSSVAIKVESFTPGIDGRNSTQKIKLIRCKWARSGQETVLEYTPDGFIVGVNPHL